MLAKENGITPDEARFKAGVSLINELARTCYTIQAKFSYFCGGKLPRFMVKDKEQPGVYKIISREEVMKAIKDTVKALKEKNFPAGRGFSEEAWCTRVNPGDMRHVFHFIDEFFKNKNNHTELVFGGGKGALEYSFQELRIISNYCLDCPWLQWRKITGFSQARYTGVSLVHTPQRLCRYLLRQDKEDIKYRLFPPQGFTTNLLKPNGQYSPNIVKHKPHRPGSEGEPLTTEDF